jgi:hypothetical protein
MSDQPKGSAPGGVPVWVFAVSLLAVAVIAGSVAWLMRSPTPTVTPLVQTTTSPTVEPTSTPSPTTTTAVEPTVAPPAEKANLPYTPGPDESGIQWAYLKKMVVKSGYVYATVDYIIIGDDPDGGWMITNDNPKLRTFPLAKTAKCRYLKEGGSTLSSSLSPTAFRTKWLGSPTDEMIRMNPYKIWLKHGVITKLDNEWLP